MGTQETSLSVFMLPWLAHGHISPFLELAKKLVNRNVFIYFCSTPINLASIMKKLYGQKKYSHLIQLVELHLPYLPELPPKYHTTNGLPPHLLPTLHKAFSLSKPTLSNTINSLNPDLIIFDVSQIWLGSLVSSVNIPGVPFNTSSAAMTSFYSHLLSNPGVEYPHPGIFLRESEMAAVRILLESVSSEAKEYFKRERPKESCDIELIKSFEGLEGKYFEYLSTLAKKRIIPVGPLVEDLVNKNEHSEVIEWLNMKDRCSSVFVSFGSEYFLTNEDMEEIAHGLELSNMNFIWVIRFPEGEKIRVEEALPKGFQERVGERGLIVENWAPQARILGHSSIGGFVSHCGWNSVMESMKFGVPIVAMPMQLDQPLNARLMVEVGMGIEVVRDNNGKLQREEVAKVIREVVVEEIGEDVRRKAKEFSKNTRDKGDEEMDVVMEELLQICGKSKRH